MSLARWVGWRAKGATPRAGFGTVTARGVEVHEGSLFDARATGELLEEGEYEIDMPCRPAKMIGLWNNFKERAAKEKLVRPDHPLYFVKTPNTYAAHSDNIVRPPGVDRVIFEGELGVVVGRPLTRASVADAKQAIFGFCCVNDVTAPTMMRADWASGFVMWTRAKGYDTFAPFGPHIATRPGNESGDLVIRTLVNGEEKQCYPVTDMFFNPEEALSAISHDMTLVPGDIVSMGTSVGAGAMVHGDTVDVVIDGVGHLRNTFVDATSA
eukprot:TRINITY_DN20442_c0_g1_i1.p1 TRINITY_DN20442_c0_g1~~TRINITY_DN20442_c0_g1_i1.p1  ORF type:complete len:268 (+),score=68.75 TRINITY_DN20442_c0_g1_i1:65-868(+)